ncbi:MAG: FliH/SctL family protein [Candidatus Eremiobacteraeota bacterium]|nr:FliH/SctL family protein [Candidatus Eremiobacteraeota bacterium]
MGRIVKGARFAQKAYAVTVPSYADQQNSNGHAQGAPVDTFEPELTFPEVEEPEVVPVDWNVVRSEAVRLIDEAQTQAEVLIQEGQQRAVELITTAAEHAQTIEDAAQADGFEQGQHDGHAAAGAELDEMLVTMRGLVDVARAERHKIIEGAEPEIIRLAMALAEKIVHQQISIDKNVVLSMAQAAIARLISREAVTVRVNPADIETIRDHKERMIANSDIEHLRLIEDNRVDRGGVVVETESGTIDAKIATQVGEAKRLMQVEDELEAVAPSDDELLIPPSAQAS